MKKLITICVIVLCSYQTIFSQLTNFAIGIRYGSEFERYEYKQEKDFGYIISQNKFQQNNNVGVAFNYTFKNRIVFETGLSWIKRYYQQIRDFDAQSFFVSRFVSQPLYTTHDYSYHFLEIPLSAKVFLSSKKSRTKPFIEIGSKATYLMKANYSTWGNHNNLSDSKKEYWGLITYGGIGVNYFWKNFIFEGNLSYKLSQKFKIDTRFFDDAYVKFDDNNKPSFTLGGAIYRNLDFRKIEK